MNYSYNPYFYQQQQMQMPVQQPQQIQNGGFVSVRGIEEARNYPVAPGNSVMFKDENAPYVYTKTMGFSQLDRPSFEIFKLVKEEQHNEQKPTEYVDSVKKDIEYLKEEVNKLKSIIEHEEVESDG